LLPQVQLQLLTATVKLFLKKPTDSVQRMIQLVLSAATNETDNPDLRDRAYVYWRLLSTDPEVCGSAQLVAPIHLGLDVLHPVPYIKQC
jgi:vesicle coat complex subunit